MITYDGFDSGDYITHGIYLSNWKILLIIGLVVFLLWLGCTDRHTKDSR